MNEPIVKKEPPRVSPLVAMAARMSVEPNKLLETLKETVFKGASNSELLALCVVANRYGLDPIVKHMYAFPGKSGGIVPVVSVDGWVNIANRQPNYDGVEFDWQFDPENGKPAACSCTIHLKDRSHPVKVTEFYNESYRKTDPWNNQPCRMLRHRAFVQAVRIAFGISGIHDEDEAAEIAVMPASKAIEVSTGAPVDDTPADFKPLPKEENAAPRTPQAELTIVVTGAGFSFDNLQAFGIESGNIPGADAMAGFDDIPKDVALRLLRAKIGLLKGLAKLKEAASLDAQPSNLQVMTHPAHGKLHGFANKNGKAKPT